MPAGGSMFEKILKRLCPCYFNRNDGSECSALQTMATKTSSTKQISRDITSGSSGTATTTTSSSTAITQDSWKGTLNIVQPQPVYAFPLDLKKSPKRNQRNLLKPPLYWKKTKFLHTNGPSVFQESRNENVPYAIKKKKKNARAAQLKPCETVADISSITSANTVEVRWLKSQSLDNIFYETSHKPMIHYKKEKKNKGDRKDGWNCSRCQVLPDISHGVILFTAAYFAKKKICMINIDRLENLSRKGREGNSYYTVVKLAVLPSEKYIKCTRILSNCSNPEVKQDFSFSVKELTGKVLRLSVFDASLQKQREAIGHALLSLDDTICDQPKKYRIKLYRRTQPHTCPGNLCLSLKYSENEDKFTIAVDKARSISLQKDKNVKLNTYVKVTLYSYGEKVKTKKSVVVMDSRDPDYNSSFTFQVRKDQIDYLSVAIAVRLKGFVNDMTIGRLNFGPFFYIDGVKLTPWGKKFKQPSIGCYSSDGIIFVGRLVGLECVNHLEVYFRGQEGLKSKLELWGGVDVTEDIS